MQRSPALAATGLPASRTYRTTVRGARECDLLPLCFFLALSCRPPGAPLALERGTNAIDESRPELARPYLEEHLTENPEDDDARLLAAEAWSSGRLQSWSRAIEHWDRYLEHHPDAAPVRFRKARGLLTLDRTAGIEVLLRPVRDQPRARLLLLRAALADPERVEAAHALARELLRDLPNDPDVLALAARAASRGSPERALELAEQAVRRRAFDQTSTYLVATLRRDLGDVDGARRAFATHQRLTELSNVDKQTEPTPTRELRLLEELRPTVSDEALDFKLRELDLLHRVGQREAARRLLASIDLATLPAGTDFEVAEAAARLGDSEGSRNILQGIVTGQGGDDEAVEPIHDVRRRTARVGLATFAYNRGDREEASARVQALLSDYPSSARGLHLAAQLALESADAEQAERLLSRALDVAPWRAETRLKLAELLLASGREGDVADLLARHPEQSPAIAAFRRLHGLEPGP